MVSRTNRRRAKRIVRGLIAFKSFHLAGWIIWFLILWLLSSGKLPNEPTPDFPFKDKVMHWGYFGIGGAFLAFYALSASGKNALSKAVFFSLLCLGVTVGIIDELHQCWDINRSGKDLGDLAADTVGTLSGLVVAQRLWRWLKVR